MTLQWTLPAPPRRRRPAPCLDLAALAAAADRDPPASAGADNADGSRDAFDWVRGAASRRRVAEAGQGTAPPMPPGAVLKEEGAVPPMPLGAFVKEEQVAPPMPPGAFVKEEGVVRPMSPDAIVEL